MFFNNCLDSFEGKIMRYLALILSSAALAGCSVAGLGGTKANSCAPYCQNYAAPAYAGQGYAQPTYTQPTYAQPFSQPASNQGYWQASNQASYSAGYATQPSPQSYGTHAYGTHAYGPPPQLRGPSNPYSARGYKYGNLGVVLYDHDSENFGVQGRIGYQSATIFGAELEGSISLGSDTDEISADELAAVAGFTNPVDPANPTATPSPGTLTTEFTNSIAAFGVARLPISDKFSVHSRAGLHSTRFKAELNDGVNVLQQNETSFDIAYGLGMSYAFTPRNDIRLDYTVYEGDAGGNADSLSVAVAHKF